MLTPCPNDLKRWERIRLGTPLGRGRSYPGTRGARTRRCFAYGRVSMRGTLPWVPRPSASWVRFSACTQGAATAVWPGWTRRRPTAPVNSRSGGLAVRRRTHRPSRARLAHGRGTHGGGALQASPQVRSATRGRLTERSIRRIIRHPRDAGVQGRISGNSLRVGRAQSLAQRVPL